MNSDEFETNEVTKLQKEFWLTTSDNPFNCFDNFDQWFAYDIACGYNTAQWIASLARVSETFSDEDNAAEVERVCRELLSLNPSGKFVLVSRDM